MEQRRVGTSGLRASRLGLGTLTWGSGTDEHDAAEALRGYVDAGGTFVDTAMSYGDGVAEQILGGLLGSVVAREDVVLATKAGVSRRHGQRVVDTSRRALLDALDGSLLRLRVDTVDLWQVHAWSDDVPLEETLSALDLALSSGRVRYAGVSNYAGWQTARAATLQRAGAAAVVSTQVEYSLLARDVEREVVPAARASGVGVLAWSPLARGVLTGKYRAGIPADSRAASPQFAASTERYLDERSRRVVDAVATAAEGLGVTPGDVALAWVRDRPGVASVLIGARTPAQLRAALASDELTLPAEIASALDDVSR